MYFNRKLIHFAILTRKNNYNRSPVMVPGRIVTIISFTMHTSPPQSFLLKPESCELHMAQCIIKRRIEWTLPKTHRTPYEKDINHFLKVSYFVTGCVHEEFWHWNFTKG